MAPIRLRYQTIEFPQFDIHLCTLRDRQEFDEDDAAAEALGISSAQWSLFGVVWPGGWALAQEMTSIDIAGRTFLEVGCGIALASIVLNHRGADINALDYHPAAGEFLLRNAALNNDPDIPFIQGDWTTLRDDVPRYDVVIASDVLYEDEHAGDVARFIDDHLTPAGIAVVADPGRGHRGLFERSMIERGFSATRSAGDQIMTFLRSSR